jgi:alpha-1,2-mannosyltransferase
MLLRAFAPGAVPGVLWLALAGLAGCAGFAAARAAWRRGDEIGGAAITGLTAVLISPVSWIHHLVWVVVALGAIAGDGRDRLRCRTAAAAAAFFLIAVPYLAWNRVFVAYAPAVLQAVLSDCDGIAAALLILIIALLPAPGPDTGSAPRAAGPGWPARWARQRPVPPALP